MSFNSFVACKHTLYPCIVSLDAFFEASASLWSKSCQYATFCPMYFFKTGISSQVEKLTKQGGVIELKDFGIRVEFPAESVGGSGSQLINLSVIPEVPRHLQVREDEIFAGFGIQCQPDGLQLHSPATVTIPHCLQLEDPSSVTPVIYAGTGRLGRNGIYDLCNGMGFYL